MLEVIDAHKLGDVTGGSPPSLGMLVLAMMLSKVKRGGLNLSDDNKRKLLDMFKGALENRAKPVDVPKAAEPPK